MFKVFIKQFLDNGKFIANTVLDDNFDTIAKAKEVGLIYKTSSLSKLEIKRYNSISEYEEYENSEEDLVNPGILVYAD